MKFFRSALLMCMLLMLGTSMQAQPNVYHSVNFATAGSVKIDWTDTLLSYNNVKKMTIEVWVKQDSTATIQPIFHSVTGTGASFIDIHIQADSVYASYGGGYVSCSFAYDTFWHHIAFTIDSASNPGNDSLSLYVDAAHSHITTWHVSLIRGSGRDLYIGSNYPLTDKFIGHMTRFVITDSILYNDTYYVPDCIFDTTTINSKTRKVISFTNWSIIGGPTPRDYIYGGYVTCLYYVDTNNSPCLPIYTFSTDTTTYAGDTIMFYAHNTNVSFNKGSSIPHTKNGWDTTILVTPTFGTFTDSIMIMHYGDTILVYDGDTTHGSKSPVIHTSGVNTIGEHSINAYPNPTTDYISIYCQSFISAEIVDLTGRTLMKSTEEKLSVKNIPAGNYLLKITSLNGYALRDILIVH